MSNADAERQFVAEATSPEPVRLYLSHTGVGASSFGSFQGLGWELVANRLTPEGDERVFEDTWYETLLEALRHANQYSATPIQWRRTMSGELVDLRVLQPAYDVSARHQTAIRTVVSPDGGQRLCFNLYDDGRYRFTLEELMREGDLSAWAPRRWSSGHSDLAEVEDEARGAFSWFCIG